MTTKTKTQVFHGSDPKALQKEAEAWIAQHPELKVLGQSYTGIFPNYVYGVEYEDDGIA